jgi:hypothetical protein
VTNLLSFQAAGAGAAGIGAGDSGSGGVGAAGLKPQFGILDFNNTNL